MRLWAVTIIREGEQGDSLFVMLSGGARVMKGETQIATLAPGEHVGEMALVDRTPRSATVLAQGPARLSLWWVS